MSKKDYVAIAETIKGQLATAKGTDHGLIVYATLEKVATQLALSFRNDNPSFKHSTFMQACGF